MTAGKVVEETDMSTVRRVFARLHASLALVGLLAVATPATADVVADWNARAVQFLAAHAATPGNRPPGPFLVIDLAIVHIAIHDAVQAYQHRFTTFNAPVPGAAGSPVAAVAKAAHDVLVSRLSIPIVNTTQIALLDTNYNDYLIANGLAVNDPGVAVGAQAAHNIIVNRANDGSFPANPEIFTGSTEPGQWRPTPPGFAPMAGPWIGDMTPFVQKDRQGLMHEPPPPSLTSGLYTRDYNEVKLLGRRTNSGRTAEQTTMAFFFSGNFVVILNNVVRDVAAARLTDIGDSARLFALAYVSGADAAINTWNSKRSYNVWRPSTAILNAADDGNSKTEPDPGWLPLINDPPYPDYTSGANSLTGAFMRSLHKFFGSDVWTFQASTTAMENGQPIAPRTYHRFSDMAQDVVDARILLGIHFRFADEVARRVAYQSADQVFAHAFK
jgi:hypothetical protein